MKRVAYMFFCLIACFGCQYDYDINDDIKDFKPSVVVNGLINPDSTIKIELFWSKHHTDIKNGYKYVVEFSAELYENGTLIKEEECYEGVWKIEYYPKEGYTYSVKFTVPNYGEVEAKTYIPTKADVKAKYTKSAERYQYVTIEQISPNEKMRAVWIRNYGEYKRENRDKIEYVYEPYQYECENVFMDQINAVLDVYYDGDSGAGDVGFEDFMRIPYSNISASLPVCFSSKIFNSNYVDNTDEDAPVDEWGDPIPVDALLAQIRVEVLSPSYNYDKYFKDIYKQEVYGYSPDLPFFGEMVNVHCNIENGIGIFAGYSSTMLTLTLPIE